MRAVTVPINAASGVGGFIFPGDRVDVLVKFTVKPEGDDSLLTRKVHFSQTLLRNVRVIGKDQNAEQTEGEAEIAKSATLEVTPKQAEALFLANEIGELSLSLRSLADDSVRYNEAMNQPASIQDPDFHNASFTGDALPLQLMQPASNEESTQNTLPSGENKAKFSFTTDYQVNYLLQHMVKSTPRATSHQAPHRVEVHRGGTTTSHDFQ